MVYIDLILAILVGYVIGLGQKGITINHKGEEVPEEYNEGSAEYLPKDVKDYAEKHNGLHKY